MNSSGLVLLEASTREATASQVEGGNHSSNPSSSPGKGDQWSDPSNILDLLETRNHDI